MQQTSGREKEKGVTQSPIAHMASKSNIVNFVVVVHCAKPHIALRKKKTKYDGHCWYCFANLFPDKPVA